VSTQLEGKCRPPSLRYGLPNSELAFFGLELGAGEGNRTLVVSLEGFCSTIELHPLVWFALPFGDRSRQPPGVDPGSPPPLETDSHEAPERHRRDEDRPPLVALFNSCGAMARLID
jgi:hypothetical protein